MKHVFVTVFCMAALASCNSPKPSEETTPTPAEVKPQPVEFADPKYSDIGKAGIAALSSGDIDAWMNSFADNASYTWSSGDSLSGKAAIAEYWKKRRTEVIDSIHFTNDIWLAIKINQPQKGPDRPGVWLMSWYQTNVKYKNGKKLAFWVHSDMHFNASDKIDRFIQYVDRAPINAALAAKK